MNNRRIGIFITEFDVFKFCGTPDISEFCSLVVLIIHSSASGNLKTYSPAAAVDCKRLHSLRHLRKRLREITHIHHKGDDYAETDLSLQSHCVADYANSNITKFADETHNRLHKS